MNDEEFELDVASMRQAFDASFARSQEAREDGQLRLLGIRAGGEAWALPLADVASIQVLRKLVRVPSRAPHLLGLVGVRGAIVPVYDLGAILGRPPAVSPGWLVLSAASTSRQGIGLAFESFEAHWRISATSLSDVIETPAGLRPVVHLASIVEALNRSTAEARPQWSPE